ncbi:MAG TPA: RecX family transcriptional regulator [Candidatus Saccharimonadales bacterium]|nr:RecX family transcriptional regulator [Candidatus Saccharimonadales bacterium]
MKITAIKQQVRQPNRYSLYVDGKYAFSLSDTALLDAGLATGQELTEADLTVLKKMSADDKAYARALNYVAIRPRSRWELVTYLRRKGVEEDGADAVIARIERVGLLNDLAFARSWVANRRLLKSVSKRRLVQELRQKHLSDDIIQTVLAEDETDDRAVLRELVRRKLQQPRYRADETKLMQYLARQGYGYDDIKLVLQEERDA